MRLPTGSDHEDDPRHARSGGHGRDSTRDREHRDEERDKRRARDTVQRFTLPTTARWQADPERSLLVLPATHHLQFIGARWHRFGSIVSGAHRQCPARWTAAYHRADGRPPGHAPPHEPARGRDQPLPAPARAQPRRLDTVGSGGAGAREVARPADLPLDRLRRLPLVPRHGARVVRGRGDGRRAQRRLRRDQGGPRGAPGPRPAVHGRRPGDDGPGRLADERVPDARGPAVLRRHLLPGHAAPRDAVVPPGARGRPPGVDDAARRARAGRARGWSRRWSRRRRWDRRPAASGAARRARSWTAPLAGVVALVRPASTAAGAGRPSSRSR